MIGRRAFLRIGAGALIAAPAIVQAASLMPVKALVARPRTIIRTYVAPSGAAWVEAGDEFGGYLVPAEFQEFILHMLRETPPIVVQHRVRILRRGSTWA